MGTIIRRLTVNHLDGIEQEMLFCWGNENYEMTVDRLERLIQMAVDPAMKMKFFFLRNKLLLTVGPDIYEQLYFHIRSKLQESMAKRLLLNKQVAEMIRRERKENQ